MYDIPITFLCDPIRSGLQTLPILIREYAANNAKHLVLADFMISEIAGNPKFSEQLLHDMASSGMTFVDSHAPFGKLVDLQTPYLRDEMILRQQLAINIAADMGVDTITMHIGADVHYPEIPERKLLDNTCEALDQILPIAEQRKVVVCIENVWFHNTSPENLLSIKSKFPTDYLGFCYDAGHANIMANGRFSPDCVAIKNWAMVNAGTPIWDDNILEKMLPHVVNCHLHNNDGAADMHLSCACGNIDWAHIIGLLKQAKRLRSIQCETVPVLRETSIATVCKDIFEIMEKYW